MKSKLYGLGFFLFFFFVVVCSEGFSKSVLDMISGNEPILVIVLDSGCIGTKSFSPQVTSYSSVAHRLDCDQAVSNSYCNVLGAHAKIQNVGNSSSLQIRQRFMRFLGRFLAHNVMPSQNGLIQTFLI
jgi:hypothetical protein